jgi:anti-sigma B factor antagonist
MHRDRSVRVLDMTDEPLMTVVTTHAGPVAVLTVDGEVDLHTAPQLVDALDAAVPYADTHGAGPVECVVADLSRVVFLSSAGLGTLAALAGRLSEDGVALRLVAGENRAVTRPWTAMHLGDLLPLYPDLPAALEATTAG